MRRAAAVGAGLLAAWAAPPAAWAAPGAVAQISATQYASALGTGELVSEHTYPATVSGQLVVSFHGDQATGCAGRGLCGYSGTVVVRPGGQAQLVIATLRLGHREYSQVELALTRTLTGSQVTRSGSAGPEGRCADEQQPVALVPASLRGGVVHFALLVPGGELLATRCAGPLEGDVAASGPSLSIPLTQLRRGDQRLDLSHFDSFSADGLAGMVSSTIAVAVGKPARPSGSRGGVPKRARVRRLRLVTEELRVTGVSGGLGASVRGSVDASECLLLDSCGLAGRLTESPTEAGARGELIAIGRATLPYRRFIAALHGRREPGITTQGTIEWHAGGTVTSALAGPSTSCSDTAPGPGAVLALQLSRHTLTATYSPLAPLRTRCPGPLLGAETEIASGRAPRSFLARRSLALTLGGAGPVSDDGYDLNLGGALHIELRRGPITRRIVRLPSG